MNLGRRWPQRSDHVPKQATEKAGRVGRGAHAERKAAEEDAEWQ